MTIVEGQIEPLKRLKEALNEKGITRFNSIGDINSFRKNYEAEKNGIPSAIESAVEAELQQIRSSLSEHQKAYDDLKTKILNELNLELKKLDDEEKQAEDKRAKGFFSKVFYYPKARRLSRQYAKLQKNLDSILKKRTRSASVTVKSTQNKLASLLKNKTIIIAERCERTSQELNATKAVIDSLYSLIAGAIGENSVVNSLQKLSDDYYLFNDFSIDFDPPIYNRKENDRIFSIQIDHLLASPSGLFLIETKNWSKQSVKNLDLRSPVKQIKRTSFALFVLLNSDSGLNNLQLDSHHWGSKKVPIRNIIVMTNAKPKEEFKHVKVLSLEELNGYIRYFDPIFSAAEVTSIIEHIKC